MSKSAQVVDQSLSTQSMGDIGLMAETVREYPYKELASKAACTWTQLKDTELNQLEVYVSKLGPYKGWVVGVGIKRPSGIVEDIVRVDMDDIQDAASKGIHFNAKNLRDTSQKFAGVITPTKQLTVSQRRQQYERILNTIKNQTARVIWLWWSTGSGRFAGDGEEVETED